MTRGDKRLLRRCTILFMGALFLLYAIGRLSLFLNPATEDAKSMIGLPAARWCRLDHEFVDCERLCRVEGKWKVCK